MFLVVVDTHAKWPEVITMSSTTTSTTINELRHHFAAYGLSKQLVTDNDPQFMSEEFSTCCKQNGINTHTHTQHTQHTHTHTHTHTHINTFDVHRTTLPQTVLQNNLFKRSRAMKASAEDKNLFNQRLTNFLLTYRCTPHATTGEAPCQLFMSRKIRTRLNLLRPSCEERVQSKQAQQKCGHDKHAHLRELENGQNVMARNFRPGPNWVPGVVEGKCGPLSYVVKVGYGQMWKWHIDHIRRYAASMKP